VDCSGPADGLSAGRETKKRRVLYLFFVEGVFKLSETAGRLKEEADGLGGDFGLVVIDTGPVFYEGDDENSRTQQGRHAVTLRELITVIPGKPAVLVNCHPVKNAAADNLLPAGGGNFLNQVDGNLTATALPSSTPEASFGASSSRRCFS
jgi:hypothetical protein